MAKEGMRLTDFHSAVAVCSASRVALMTGCYPQRVGILGALGPNAKTGINASEVLLPEILKDKGYATAIFGKWHLGDAPQFLPTRHGFDQYFGLPYSNDMWPKHPTNRSFPDLPLIDREPFRQAYLADADVPQRATAFAAGARFPFVNGESLDAISSRNSDSAISTRRGGKGPVPPPNRGRNRSSSFAQSSTVGKR
jgi:arylsulfatase A-like enzyme